MQTPRDEASESGPVGTPVFLVLERDMLIAVDIVDSLKATGPCRAIHVSRFEEIAAALAQETSVHAAFLQMRFAQVMESDLHHLLLQKGAAIILTVGDDDTDKAREAGWGMLVRPFTEMMIREALAPLKQP